jgi:hypothetical protein
MPGHKAQCDRIIVTKMILATITGNSSAGGLARSPHSLMPSAFSISWLCFLENVASTVTEAGEMRGGVLQEMFFQGQTWR